MDALLSDLNNLVKLVRDERRQPAHHCSKRCASEIVARACDADDLARIQLKRRIVAQDDRLGRRACAWHDESALFGREIAPARHGVDARDALHDENALGAVLDEKGANNGEKTDGHLSDALVDDPAREAQRKLIGAHADTVEPGSGGVDAVLRERDAVVQSGQLVNIWCGV